MTREEFWRKAKLNGLLVTICGDKIKVLDGLREQDQSITYSTSEVIAVIELIFALVETSVITEMEYELHDKESNFAQPN